EVDAIKKHLQGIIDENTALRLENSKLRERLEKEDKTGHKQKQTCQILTSLVYQKQTCQILTSLVYQR
ncbi:initiation control protein YabA, partial [Streptococcus ruminantium]|uniref:initiation control protein YabA n=1 Tax=Streptococcus ruminantium TaxID=1917441 RepID=UPI00358E62C2